METILVVDDEAQVRALPRDILLGAGYQVLEAEDGEQALRVVEQHLGGIHVLLTDIMMPGINGEELADRLAPSTRIPRPSSCPVAPPR
jgi:CheY-like chemotaxis protein